MNNYSFLNPLKHWKVCRTIWKENPDVVILNGRNELKLGAISSCLLRVNKIIYRRGNGKRIRPQRIAVLGRLSMEKGVDLAIMAFKRIRQELPAARLVIIGEGGERQALMRLSDQFGMDGSVEFVGFQENPTEVLSGCSVLMIPSRWEGFSYAKLEAMSLKMPVVAFGETGFDYSR
ncbi:MAG: glycosyltransferase [bacterium]